MKVFLKISIVFLIGLNQLFACSCDSAVMSAYMKQIEKLKGYYAELQNEIRDLSKELQKYQENYEKTFTRREAELELLRQRVVAIKKQRKIIEQIRSMPVSLSSQKNKNLQNEILLLKNKK